MQFKIEKRNGLARAGRIKTAHGVIETPAFVVVGTKATVKGVTPEMVKTLGAQVVLGNTYHLYLEPGEEVVRAAGGLGKFMNWSGPTMTDSGGFQVFSLGVAFGKSVSKVAISTPDEENFASSPHRRRRGTTPTKFSSSGSINSSPPSSLVKIDEDGVTFKSLFDGSEHRFTPEKSLQIQHALGADIIFAFDECTSSTASYEYQKEAMARTHAWAERSLAEHKRLLRVTLGKKESLGFSPSLFGIVQGGRFADLRAESARFLSTLGVDGFGLGGSFNKEDIKSTVALVNQILPENKPRHLLGIGAVEDLFAGVEAGVDTFDCVTPTRLGRHGALETSGGRMNIRQARYRTDFAPIEEGCECYTCVHYTRAYLAHLFRAEEMLGGTLASIHNLYFFVNLVKKIRQSLLDDSFETYRKQLFVKYNQTG